MPFKFKDKAVDFSTEIYNKIYEKWDNIAKPLRGLGLLEEIVAKIGAITNTTDVDVSKRCIVIMCADNGVVAQKVTQASSIVTAIMASNFVRGTTTVCNMAKHNNVDIIPVDIGINYPVIDGIVNKKIMMGTNDMSLGPAMSRDEAIKAINIGIDLMGDIYNRGYKLVATGEMGIGNTTTSTACASVLFGIDPKVITGRGAGLDDDGLKRKIDVISAAINLNSPNQDDPIDIISKVGGLDIAGMVGLYIGAAMHGLPIIIDGFISTISAALAIALYPEASKTMIASHSSSEPGGRILLEKLNLKPIIDAKFCLGEGTGAVALIPLIDTAIHVYKNAATFNDINIEQYVHFK